MWAMIKEMQVPDTLTHTTADMFGGNADTQPLIRPSTWVQCSEGRFVMPEEAFFVDRLFTIHCTWTPRPVDHRGQTPAMWRGRITPLNTRSSEERNSL